MSRLSFAAALRFCAFLLFANRGSAKNVAVVIAGLHRGTPLTASEYERAIVAPLQRVNWEVHTYLGGFAEEEAAWRGWLSGSASNVTFVRLPTDEERLAQFPLSGQYFNSSPGCTQPYGTRNMHLESTWSAAMASGITYHYAVKLSLTPNQRIQTRNDVLYGPAQFLRPCWLGGLASNTVLINDIELHATDRWAERGHENVRVDFHKDLPPTTPWAAQQTLPLITSDQFMASTSATMDVLFRIASQPPNTNPLRCQTGDGFWEWIGHPFPGNPENVFADFMYRRQIAWYPISLQLKRAPKANQNQS